MEFTKKDGIKLSVAISILFIIILVVIFIIIQYQFEGEKNMPYTISKITIISTAEGETIENTDRWNLRINQNNDVYFFIDKNILNNDEVIEKVRFENIKVISNPTKGEIKTYMPSSIGNRKFINSEEYIVNEKLEYKAGIKSDSKILEIGNQGGVVLIRFSNMNIGNLVSNEDKEIKHDGTLLNKIGINENDFKFKVNFDFIIEVKGIKYKSNITLDFPNENIIEKGTTHREINITKEDNKNIIFKRVK